MATTRNGVQASVQCDNTPPTKLHSQLGLFLNQDGTAKLCPSMVHSLYPHVIIKNSSFVVSVTIESIESHTQTQTHNPAPRTHPKINTLQEQESQQEKRRKKNKKKKQEKNRKKK